MSAKSEIEYLAKYIMENVPGEPSQSEGAGHCAVRIIRNLQEQLDDSKRKYGILRDKAQQVSTYSHEIFRLLMEAKIGESLGQGFSEHEPDYSEGKW